MGRRFGRHAGGPFVLIVVDSSVWIDHFRNYDSAQVRMLRSPANRDLIVVGDVVLLEVLQGMRSEPLAASTEHWLRSFIVMPMLDADLAIQAARNYRLLRQRGVTVRKTADLVIGTFCIAHHLPLLHDDRDFTHMERHLGLAAVPA